MTLRVLRSIAVASVALGVLTLGADAQEADPAAEVVGFVCANQSTVAWILSALIAHFGLSVSSAVAKKLGYTQGAIVSVIRLLAIDLKPKDAAIVAEAAEIKAQGKA